MTTKQLLAQLKKVMVKEFGKKECKEFNWFCASCTIWMIYEAMESLLTDDWEHK